MLIELQEEEEENGDTFDMNISVSDPEKVGKYLQVLWVQEGATRVPCIYTQSDASILLCTVSNVYF